MIDRLFPKGKQENIFVSAAEERQALGKAVIKMEHKKALSVVSVFAAAAMLAGCSGEKNVYVDVSELSKGALQSKINATGLVESGSCSKVYSNANLRISTVNVEVGDSVKKGDILASLDTEEINNQILQLQDEIARNGVSTGYTITEAEQTYNDALDDYNSGENREIENARNSLDNAKESLAKAQEKYDEAVRIKNSDRDSQLKSAENALELAKLDLEFANKNLADAKADLETPDLSSIETLKTLMDDAKKVYDDSLSADRYEFEDIEGNSKVDTNISIKEARKKLNEATEKYENAKEKIIKSLEDAVSLAEKNVTVCTKSVRNAENSLNDVKNGNEVQISEYEDAVSTARKNVELAQDTYDYAVKSTENQLETLRLAAEKARVLSGNSGYDFQMEALEKKLDESIIVAPADGIVTAVYAVEGSYANGIMFVIEDMNNLKVTSSVKEFDIIGIEKGEDVIIRSSALDNKEFDGVVTKVSPVTEKNADGSTVENGSYGIEVAVSEEDTGLLIGMSAKLSIITEEKDDIFSVRYDMLSTDEDGNDVVYAAEKNGDSYVVKQIPVTLGIETDSEVEIIGEGLEEGMYIIEDTDNISDGMTVMVRNGSTEEETSAETGSSSESEG